MAGNDLEGLTNHYGALMDVPGAPEASTGAAPVVAPDAPQAVPPAVKRYGDLMDQAAADRTAAAKGAIVAAGDANPDTAARARAVGGSMGLPGSAVEPSLPALEQQQALASATKAVDANPVLAGWLADNPDAARIAKDDFDKLDFVSKTMKALSSGFSEAYLTNLRGRLGSEALVGGDRTQAVADVDARLKASPALGGIYGALQSVAGFTGGLLDNFLHAQPEGAVGAAIGGAAGASAGGIGAAPGAAAGYVAGTGIGFKWDMSRVAAGNTYLDLGKIQGRNGEPIDETARQAASVLVGLGTYAIAGAGVHAADKAYGEAASSFMRQAVTEAVTQPTVQRALTRFATNIGKSGLQGAALMGAQEGVTIAGEELAKQFSPGDFSTLFNDPATRQEAFNRILTAAVDGAAMMGVVQLPASIGGLVGDSLRVRQARSDMATFAALEQGAADTRTRARAPDLFRDFLERQANGSPVENVMVPETALRSLYQSAHLEPGAEDDALFGWMPDIKEQMEQAAATGGDIVIPTSDYLTHVAGTPLSEMLRNDIRLRPDGFTLNEASAYEQERSAHLADNAAGLQAQLVHEIAASEPERQVYDDMFSKLRVAGYTNDVAQQYAALFASRYQARAERLQAGGYAGGEKSAFDLYKAEGVDVRRVLPQSLARVAVDERDMVINALRNNRKLPSDADIYGPSLTEYISKSGGIVDTGGELKAMDVAKAAAKEKGRDRTLRDLLRHPELEHANDYTPDAWALRAWEAGYFPEAVERPTPDDLFDAIRDDLNGNRHYVEGAADEAKAAFKAGVADLDQFMTEHGLDVAKMSNAEIKQAIKGRMGEEAQGASFEQSAPSEDLAAFEAQLKDRLGLQHLSLSLSTAQQDTMSIGMIEVPKGARGQGVGTRAMQEITAYADAHGLRITLTPGLRDDRHGTTSRGRLVKFYKQFGFIENKGRNKDFSISDGMYREPQPGASFEQGAAGKTVDVGGHALPLNDDGTVTLYHATRSKEAADAVVRDKTLRTDKEDQVYLSTAARGTGYGDHVVSVNVDPALLSLDDEFPDGRADFAVKGKAVAVADASRVLEQEGARGRIMMSDGAHIVELFKNADLSTLLHESGHLFLDELTRDATGADAPAQLRDDLAAVLKWMGVKDASEIGVEQHEMFARGFEAYLMEGKAPSGALAAAFQKFKSWLVGIYRNLVVLKAPISDEMRAVFDRLVATDGEIESARQREGLNPVFATAEDAGMTQAEFKAYTDGVAKAKAQAEQKLLSRTMAKIRAQRTAEWKQEAAVVRAEVLEGLRRRADLKSQYWLRTGKMLDDPEAEPTVKRVKISRDALVDMYGNEEAPGLMPKGTYTNKGGVHPDELAEIFGYRSGDELTRALMSLEATRRQAAEATGQDLDGAKYLNHLADNETRERMLERRGDALADGSIEGEAIAAVQNAAQADVMATELRALARKAGMEPPLTLEDLQRWVGGQLADMNIRRGANAGSFTRLEAKAGRETERALLKGDVRGAFEARQRQLLNHLMARTAREISDMYDRGAATFARLARQGAAKAIDQAYMDRIHDLLKRAGYQTVRSDDELGRGLGTDTLADFVRDRQAQGQDLVVANFLLDGAWRKDVADMTVDEFGAFKDAIDSLVHAGRDVKTITIAGERYELDQVVSEAVGVLDQMAKHAPPREINAGTAAGLRGALERARSLMRQADAALLKQEQVFDWLDDRNPDGVFNRAVFRPLKEAQHRENDLLAAVSGRVRALSDIMPEGWAKRLNDRREYPELTDRRTGQAFVFRRQDILSLALNVGNESNFDKLTQGYGWSRDKVNAVLDRELTKADWDFVQGVWDTFEMLWPDIEAMTRRVTGIGPEKVAARTVSTRFGDYAGGYYPVVYDPLKSTRTELQAAKSAVQMFENDYFRATTPKGHTITRVDNYAAPIRLSLDIIPWKLGQSVHDLAFREAVMDADKLLSHPDIRRGVDGALGHEYTQQFRRWLQSIANERNIDDKGLAGLDWLARQARVNATVVGIGFRASTMLKHGSTALFNSFGELGARTMLRGAAEVYGSPAKFRRSVDFVMQQSGEMRHRMDSIDRDVRESLRTLQGDHGAVAWVEQHAHYGVAMLDMGSAMPTWVGAYRAALDEGVSNADAVYRADKAVRNAHGAQGVTDLAQIQRGGEIAKLFTMFYGFFNHIYNRQRDTLRVAGGIKGQVQAGNFAGARRDFGMVLARSFYYLFVPAMVEAIASEGTPNDQNNESWTGWASRAILGEIPAGIPLVRDVAKYAMAELSGKGASYEMSPVERAVETATMSLVDLTRALGLSDKEPSARWLQHAIETPGYVFGLPTGQGGATVQYLWDLWNGDESADGVTDFLRGLMYGPKPKGQS